MTTDHLTYRLDQAPELAAELEAPIVYLVPSRGRPHNVAELLEAWAATLSDVPVAELVVMLDEDDPELKGYLDVIGGVQCTELPEWANVTIGPRLRLGPTLNHVAPYFAADRIAVGFMGDDHRPRTKGFDERILEAHRAGYLVVYGNDLVRGAALPTACTIDGRVITTLGYMVPPGAVHLYLDDYWRTLGTDLGRLRYEADVIIEHLHPTAGTAAHDAGYAEVNAPELYKADEQVYRAHLAEQHPADLANLRRLIP